MSAAYHPVFLDAENGTLGGPSDRDVSTGPLERATHLNATSTPLANTRIVSNQLGYAQSGGGECETFVTLARSSSFQVELSSRPEVPGSK